MIATATFETSDWTQETYDDPADGPDLSRASLNKTYAGDLVGTSQAHALFCGMASPPDGAGYVVSERVTGALLGREGSFVIQHGGLMGGGTPPTTFGSVVPGSGTGALAGLSGTVELGQDADGGHTAVLTVELPADG